MYIFRYIGQTKPGHGGFLGRTRGSAPRTPHLKFTTVLLTPLYMYSATQHTLSADVKTRPAAHITWWTSQDPLREFRTESNERAGPGNEARQDQVYILDSLTITHISKVVERRTTCVKWRWWKWNTQSKKYTSYVVKIVVSQYRGCAHVADIVVTHTTAIRASE